MPALLGHGLRLLVMAGHPAWLRWGSRTSTLPHSSLSDNLHGGEKTVCLTSPWSSFWGETHEYPGSPKTHQVAFASAVVFHSMCSGGRAGRAGAFDDLDQPPVVGGVSDGYRKLVGHVGVERLRSTDAGQHLANRWSARAACQEKLVGGSLHRFCPPSGRGRRDALHGNWLGPRASAGCASFDHHRRPMGQFELAFAVAFKAGGMTDSACTPSMSGRKAWLSG